MMTETLLNNHNNNKSKECLIEKVEFTPFCAEAWAYCIANSKLFCTQTCINESFDKCILCDELRSGPGFKYGAGRTRRNSGIISSIERHPNELPSFPIDHTRYLKQS